VLRIPEEGDRFQVDPLYDEGTIAALRVLKEDVAALADRMALDSRAAIAAWEQAVDTRLLPRLMPEFPLVAAICGGGSSGKSTLFNAMAGESVSPTGGRAGINRRILISLNTAHRRTSGIAKALFDPFGCPPRRMTDTQELTTPGDPLLHYSSGLPAGLALLDTPDFDTGAGGSYQNREMAERSLRAADVLIYIFTNANYNNRDNTDFVARMLTAVGTRNCFLVYRAYSGFTDAEILEHAGTVAKNLYGDTAPQHVLGVYRAGEDNQVAAGQRAMALVPVVDGQPGLMAALAQMDPRQVRGALHRSIFSDVIHQGQQFLEEARESREHLSLYLTGLRKVQQRSVQDALGHLPMDAVVRRFSEIWQDTDPTHVKIMRTTGRVVETPVRLLMRAAKWVGGRKPTGETDLPDGGDMAVTMEADLIRAANRLHQATVDPAVVIHLAETDPAIGPLREAVHKLAQKTGASAQRSDTGMVTFQVPLHPALATTQAALRSQNWSAVVDDMLARQERLLGLTSQLEADLQRLAHEQRARMTTVDQIRQTFSAMLNIIPATAAVTYVLHTGDPVGAVGIKVKLAGLFGLNDLYALVAIPATAGMKKADLKQLETMLAPVARAWLTHKLTAIEALFEEKITGTLLQRGQEMADHTANRIESMTESLARCGRALEKNP
jgi:energy-coupling factor transporter ATP-binding protein EcfA2